MSLYTTTVRFNSRNCVETTTTSNSGFMSYDYGTGSSVSSVAVYSNNTIAYPGWTTESSTSSTSSTSSISTTVNFYNWGSEATEWSTSVYHYNPFNKSVVWPKLSPGERLRQIMANRCAPAFISNRKALDKPFDIREQRARETLCRVIGEDKYKRFIVQGHVTARAKSGLVYQIFPGSGITNVYDQGKKIERLCVVLKGDFPPTDSLIMRYLMILNNEENFRSYAIKHNVWPDKGEIAKSVQPKSLVEIYKDIKLAA